MGAEGPNFQHERVMLISDSAPEFSEAAIRPCTDEGLRQVLGSAAHPFAMDLDWERVAGRFVHKIESCSLQAQRASESGARFPLAEG
jgi:hypothetical protein